MEKEMLPVIIVEAGDEYLQEIDTLGTAFTLEEAKAAATAAGYDVIDHGTGGCCETTDAWSHRQAHIVTVSPAA